MVKSLSAPLLCVFLLAGCVTSMPPTPGSERYMVSALHTPFYQYGPAQGVGADSTLEHGTPLTLLYRSYGYSRVMLQSGISGYVSTEAIAPLPPEPKPSPSPASKSRKSAHASRPSAEEPPIPTEMPLGLPELPSEPAPPFRY